MIKSVFTVGTGTGSLAVDLEQSCRNRGRRGRPWQGLPVHFAHTVQYRYRYTGASTSTVTGTGIMILHRFRRVPYLNIFFYQSKLGSKDPYDVDSFWLILRLPGRAGPLPCSLIHVLGKEHTLGMSHCRIVANQSSFESSRRKACCDIARAFRRNHFAHSQQLQGPVPLVRGKLRALPPLSHVRPPAGSGTAQGAIAALTMPSMNLRAGDSRTVLSAAAAGLGAVFSDEGLKKRHSEAIHPLCV